MFVRKEFRERKELLMIQSMQPRLIAWEYMAASGNASLLFIYWCEYTCIGMYRLRLSQMLLHFHWKSVMMQMNSDLKLISKISPRRFKAKQVECCAIAESVIWATFLLFRYLWTCPVFFETLCTVHAAFFKLIIYIFLLILFFTYFIPCTADLGRMYNLVSRITDGLGELKKLLETHIHNQGLAAIEKCGDSALNVRQQSRNETKILDDFCSIWEFVSSIPQVFFWNRML